MIDERESKGKRLHYLMKPSLHPHSRSVLIRGKGGAIGPGGEIHKAPQDAHRQHQHHKVSPYHQRLVFSPAGYS